MFHLQIVNYAIVVDIRVGWVVDLVRHIAQAKLWLPRKGVIADFPPSHINIVFVSSQWFSLTPHLLIVVIIKRFAPLSFV